MDELLSVEEVERLLQADEAKNYTSGMPFFYSGWDYPTLMWCVGRFCLYQPCDKSAFRVLGKLTTPLMDENKWPESSVKKALFLSSVFDMPILADDFVEPRLAFVRERLGREGVDHVFRQWSGDVFASISKSGL